MRKNVVLDGVQISVGDRISFSSGVIVSDAVIERRYGVISGFSYDNYNAYGSWGDYVAPLDKCTFILLKEDGTRYFLSNGKKEESKTEIFPYRPEQRDEMVEKVNIPKQIIDCNQKTINNSIACFSLGEIYGMNVFREVYWNTEEENTLEFYISIEDGRIKYHCQSLELTNNSEDEIRYMLQTCLEPVNVLEDLNECLQAEVEIQGEKFINRHDCFTVSYVVEFEGWI